MREPLFDSMRSTLAPDVAMQEAVKGVNPSSFTKLAGMIGQIYPGGGKGAAPGAGYGEEDEFHGEPSTVTSHGMTQGSAGRNAVANFGGGKTAMSGVGSDDGTNELNSPYSHSQLLEMLMKMLREHPERREEIMAEINKMQGGAKRLKAGGYVCGKSGGQADDRPVKIPHGSYVANATIVSLLGDGNSNNGDKKLEEFEKNVLRSSPFIRGERGKWEPTKKVDALVSDGERIIHKKVVDALGRGNNVKGAKILDKAFKNVLAHKGVKSILPPKTKPLTSYIGRI